MIPRFSHECNGKLCQLHPEFKDKEAYIRVKDVINFLEKYKIDTEETNLHAMAARMEILRDFSRELNEPICTLIQKGAN
jgi:uncharacterized protein YbcI